MKCRSEIQLQIGPSSRIILEVRVDALAVDESTQHRLEKSKVNKPTHLGNIQFGVCRISK